MKWMTHADPKQVYGQDPQNYDLYRPKLPPEFISEITDPFLPVGEGNKPVVIDMGAGTGRIGRHFLERGCQVIFVEPNDSMRKMLVEHFSANPDAIIVEGTCEHSNLGEIQADLIVMGDAAHWFPPTETIKEFSRILKPEGGLAAFNVMWAQDYPITVKLDSLLRAYFEHFAEGSLFFDAPHIRKLQGGHLMSNKENYTRGYTFSRYFSKEDFLQYMKTLSWYGAISKNEEGFQRNVTNLLWKFARDKGYVNDKDEVEFAFEVNARAGGLRQELSFQTSRQGRGV